jgi:hypothetical protein
VKSDDDPGWGGVRRILLGVVLPAAILRPAGDGSGPPPLVLLRQVYVAFATSLLLIGGVSVVLAASLERAGSISEELWALGVIGIGIATNVLPTAATRPLDCTSDASLLDSYRKRYFLRLAFANTPPLIGFLGVTTTGAAWLCWLGIAIASTSYLRIAPTRTRVERDEQELALTGCGRSLWAVLRGAPQS